MILNKNLFIKLIIVIQRINYMKDFRSIVDKIDFNFNIKKVTVKN